MFYIISCFSVPQYWEKCWIFFSVFTPRGWYYPYPPLGVNIEWLRQPKTRNNGNIKHSHFTSNSKNSLFSVFGAWCVAAADAISQPCARYFCFACFLHKSRAGGLRTGVRTWEAPSLRVPFRPKESIISLWRRQVMNVPTVKDNKHLSYYWR